MFAGLGRLVGLALGLPLAVLAACFAVSNRAAVRVELWPLPLDVEVPVYLLGLGAFLAGFLAACLVLAASVARVRLAAAAERRRGDALAGELEAIRRRRDRLVAGQRTDLAA
ncbi:MAG: hypothetical protein OHK0024_11360 [Thalassobaculales bacterium]